MESIKFVINETPYACWDWELQKKNLEFLESIDPDYFSYIVKINSENLEGDDKQKAAISLRLAYSHGLETFFALICSLIQAPYCTIGWMLNYRTSELVNIVRKITSRTPVLSRFRETPVTWQLLATLIHGNLGSTTGKSEWIKKGFEKLWLQFAKDFTDENFSFEYNSLKHGLRARFGGFHLYVGHEDTPGVLAPPEKMMCLCSSEFGTSYYCRENFIPKNKVNFRPRRHSRNWSPLNLANGLLLLSMSIENTLSFLRILNGAPPEKCKFSNPITEDQFELPWKESLGADNLNLDFDIEKSQVTPLSKQDIINSYTAS